jgi:hypothetical protein
MRWYQRTLPGWYDYQYEPGTDHQCCLVTVSRPDLGPGLGPQTADLELAWIWNQIQTWILAFWLELDPDVRW